VTGARASEVGQNVDVLLVQRDIARRNYERMKRLFAEQAATARELDQAERDYRVLVQQIEAARAQRHTAGEDVTTGDARVAQIAERIAKSRVLNPVSGTVLVTYAEAGEVVQQGQPLYKVADTDSLVVRAYIAETQLARVKVGQTVQVTVDVADGKRVGMPGVVTWISPEAEFTPTPIQTRDERGDLVYAIKIRVANPRGVAKIGMPADVRFADASRETP
jgi:HlyD family secretion protein